MSKDYWYRLLFKVKLYEVAGEAFQHLVNSVLGATFQGFQSIAPWGSAGDGGNDGWVKDEGRYFQVYGPRASSSWKPVTAAQKATEDFAKLKAQWSGMRRYTFVLNDRFDGIPAPVVQCLNELETTLQVGQADAMGAAEQTDLFMALSEDRKMGITGGAPSDTLTDLEPGALKEILQYLADKDTPIPSAAVPVAPDFEEKIAFNQLPKTIATRLRTNSYHISDVDVFFKGRDTWIAENIAEVLRGIYNECVVTIPAENGDAPALRYVLLLEKMVPEIAKSHPHSLKAYRQAAEMVVAKYFEACDVYEEP